MKKMLVLCFAAQLIIASGFAQDKMGSNPDKMDKMGKKKSKKSKDKMDKIDKKKPGDKMDKK
jgi:hypothetical protein